MLNTPCSEVVWKVLATYCIRQFALHFPSRASPCAITFQLDSTTTYRVTFAVRNSGCAHSRKHFFVFSVCCFAKQFSVHETNSCAQYFHYDYKSWGWVQLSDCISLTPIGVSLSGHHPCNLDVWRRCRRIGWKLTDTANTKRGSTVSHFAVHIGRRPGQMDMYEKKQLL